MICGLHSEHSSVQLKHRETLKIDESTIRGVGGLFSPPKSSVAYMYCLLGLPVYLFLSFLMARQNCSILNHHVRIVLHVGSEQVDKVLPTVDDSPLG